MSENENPSVPSAPSAGAPVPPSAPSAGAPVPPSAPSAGTPVPPSAPSAGAPVPPPAAPTGVPVPPSAPSAGAPVPPPPSAPSAGAAVPPPAGYYPPQHAAPAPAPYPPAQPPAGAPYPGQPAAAPYPGQAGAVVPGYQQPAQPVPYPAQAPGAPQVPGAPQAPGAGNGITVSIQTQDVKAELLAIWQVVAEFFRAFPVKAYQIAESRRFYGLLVMLFSSLFSALLTASLQSSVVSSASRAGQSLSDWFEGGNSREMFSFSMPWSAWFSTFFTVFFAVLVILFLRVLVTFLTMRIHKAPVGFKRALTIVGVSMTPLYFSMAVVWVLSLFPSVLWVSILTVIAVAVFGWLGFAGELMIYLGISRAARYQRSPLLTHATLTAVWGLFAFLFFVFLIIPTVGNIFPSFGALNPIRF